MVVLPPPVRVVWVNSIHRDGSRIGQELLDAAAEMEAEAQAVVALLLPDVNRTAEIIELAVQLAWRSLRRGAVPPTNRNTPAMALNGQPHAGYRAEKTLAYLGMSGAIVCFRRMRQKSL
jgi:hypothetical protein